MLFGEVEEVCLGPEAKLINQTGPISLELGEHLTADQQNQLKQIEKEFEKVFSSKPGRTNRVEHRI